MSIFGLSLEIWTLKKKCFVCTIIDPGPHWILTERIKTSCLRSLNKRFSFLSAYRSLCLWNHQDKILELHVIIARCHGCIFSALIVPIERKGNAKKTTSIENSNCVKSRIWCSQWRFNEFQLVSRWNTIHECDIRPRAHILYPNTTFPFEGIFMELFFISDINKLLGHRNTIPNQYYRQWNVSIKDEIMVKSILLSISHFFYFHIQWNHS